MSCRASYNEESNNDKKPPAYKHVKACVIMQTLILYYTVSHKFRTYLYFCSNFSKSSSIFMKLYQCAREKIGSVSVIFTYSSFKYVL